jgi:hypothetical protein
MDRRLASRGACAMSSISLAAARARAIAAQQQVASADPPFAAMACPGAGKTRVIVDRHLTHPVVARQGRAITSFTRVAAAEVSRRCATAGAGRPDRPPALHRHHRHVPVAAPGPAVPSSRPGLAPAGILARRASQLRRVRLRPELSPR